MKRLRVGTRRYGVTVELSRPWHGRRRLVRVAVAVSLGPAIVAGSLMGGRSNT